MYFIAEKRRKRHKILRLLRLFAAIEEPYDRCLPLGSLVEIRMMLGRGFLAALLALSVNVAAAADTVLPYVEGEVAETVLELWGDLDFRKDPLDVEVVEEWIEEGIVCRYVIYTVGTFKGAKARVAAFYTFPEGMVKGPAFVWSHGGGQRAERERGHYFARQGFATVDINWGGREIVEGIEQNTDWGAVDPSQGPRFYPGALRDSTKLNLLPDEHTIDSVVSPRNGNWFLLTFAGRRAITFLEQQPEVDPEKIGFTGYSMGGNITSYCAIDERLKAVAPMVGGSGFNTRDFPGLPDSGQARVHKEHSGLFAATIESQSYYEQVKCPVLMLSASNDFHAIFERVYNCMEVLPHDDWRASMLMHYNHSLGPEQWILLNRWFDLYLKGEGEELPKTAMSTLAVVGDVAVFTVTPDQVKEIEIVEVYYSHDPNPRTRFWISADAVWEGSTWTARLPVREKLPLFAFANCRYPLGEEVEAFRGMAKSFTITSDEEVYLPEEIDAGLLWEEAQEQAMFADFEKDGFRGWGLSPRGGLATYKFQDPRVATPGADRALRVVVDLPGDRMSVRMRLSKNTFLYGVKGPKESFATNRPFPKAGEQVFVLRASDFVEGEKLMRDWENIASFALDVYDGGNRVNLDFSVEANQGVLKRLEWVAE